MIAVKNKIFNYFCWILRFLLRINFTAWISRQRFDDRQHSREKARENYAHFSSLKPTASMTVGNSKNLGFKLLISSLLHVGGSSFAKKATAGAIVFV